MTETKKGRFRVVVYPDWCKGCGICAAFCPKKVLAVGPEGKARVVAEANCVNCGFCELHCPDFAIVLAPQNGNNYRAKNGATKPAQAAEPAKPDQPDKPDQPAQTDKEPRP